MATAYLKNGSTLNTEDVVRTQQVWYGQRGRYLSDGVSPRPADALNVSLLDGSGVTLEGEDLRNFTGAMDPGNKPDTSITSGPAEGSTSPRNVTFGFSSTKTGSSFEASLDNGAWQAVNSSYALSNLSGGSHTLRVRAVDAYGNQDDTPAVRTWTVDATAPTVTGNTPANNATAIARTANLTATFSEAMEAATINSTNLTLTKRGGAAIAKTVTYDAATRVATVDPTPTLDASSIYDARIKGPGGVRDANGNDLAADFSWAFTTGTT